MFINSIKMYRELSEQQKQFIRDGGINAELSIPKWVKLLEPLCRYDECSDNTRKKLLKWIIAGFILSFLSFFISTVLQSVVPIFIIIGSTILLSIVYAFSKRSDINDNVRDVVFPLLQMLSLEVGNNKKIHLKLDFHKKLARKDITEVVKGNGKSVFYCYEVLTVNCDLIDNSHFSMKVLDTIRLRTRTRGGKTKTKTKLKRRIALQMTFAKDFYELYKQPSDPSTFREKESKIVYKKTFKQSAEGKTALIELDKVIDAAHFPYSYLQPKRASL